MNAHDAPIKRPIRRKHDVIRKSDGDGATFHWTSFPVNNNNRLTALCLELATWVSQYQKGKTSLDTEWQWHQLGHMQICTSPQRDKHASTPPLGFWPTVLSVEPLVHCVVCLSVSSVTFCIVVKRYISAKNCLKERIGNQGQKVDFLSRRHISTSVSPLRPLRRPFLPYFCPYSLAISTRWYKWTCCSV